MNHTAESSIRIQVLGLFGLVVGGAPIELPLQAQRVLGYLAVIQPVQSRSALAGCLWGDMPQNRAMAALRNALWQLRKVPAPVIRTSRDKVSMDPSVRTDLANVRSCAATIASGGPQDTEFLAIDLFDCDLLTAWEEDWLCIERERCRQMRIHTLESLAELLTRQGRHAQAIQAALAAVRAEPLRETAQVILIKAHLSEGNTCEAIRQFEAFRILLADELGLQPSPRVKALMHK